MKDSLVAIRVKQCLALAEASPCPRRKLGAMLIDPQRNVILADGYNGGPRKGEGPLCAGGFCEREGFDPSKSPVQDPELVAALSQKYPPIESGTRMERGCHHAEMNVICNAAAGGIRTRGAWLIVLAEPCMMCAKMVHHAGVDRVLLVDGGYAGGKEGVDYLNRHGVEIQYVEGPKDPRMGK